MSFFVSHVWSLAVFMAVLAVIAVTNLAGLKRLGRCPVESNPRRVSILVPARNEERNIVACVESLLRQDYPKFEVIVLDDDSSDGTGELLRSLQAQWAGRLRILPGDPLPAGWLGKNWACHQLAQAAEGEVLLFTDADTVHDPATLLCAISALHAEKAGGLS